MIPFLSGGWEWGPPLAKTITGHLPSFCEQKYHLADMVEVIRSLVQEYSRRHPKVGQSCLSRAGKLLHMMICFDCYHELDELFTAEGSWLKALKPRYDLAGVTWKPRVELVRKQLAGCLLIKTPLHVNFRLLYTITYLCFFFPLLLPTFRD